MNSFLKIHTSDTALSVSKFGKTRTDVGHETELYGHVNRRVKTKKCSIQFKAVVCGSIC
jgi:hypothetical protein